MLKQIDNMMLLQRQCRVAMASLDTQQSSATQLRMTNTARPTSSTYAGFGGHVATLSCAMKDQAAPLMKREIGRGRKASAVTKVAARDAPTSPTYDLPSFSEETTTLSESAVDFLQQQCKDQVATGSFLDNVQKLKVSLQGLGQSENIYEISNVVSQLQRLGVDGYFKSEIRELLANLNRRWKSICSEDEAAAAAPDSDLGIAAMTFSLLRSHGYEVTAQPLTSFVKDGKLFGTRLARKDGASHIASMLHLKCATDLMFPGEEDTFRNVRRSTIEYLTEVLDNNANIPSSLSSQIQHELVYHWYRKIPIVETLQYLKIYKDGDPWTGSSAIRDLAMENLSFWQPRLLQEIEIIDRAPKLYAIWLAGCRWNKGTKIPELPFVRDIAELLNIVMVSSIAEPQYRANRLAMVKLGTLGYVVDDLFDEHASLAELRTFTEYMRRWDPSLPESFPEPVKVLYNATWETTNNLAQQASAVQGRDLHPYFRRVISQFVDSQLVEAEWAASKYEPSFDEYMENAVISVAVYSSSSLAVYFRAQLSEEQVEHEDYVRLYQLMTYIARLMNDIDGYKRDKNFDGQANVVGIIMRESDGKLGEAEAIDKIMKMVEQARTEILQLLLLSSSIPADAKGLFLMSIRFSLLSTDTSHPFAKCLQGRPEKMPDNTRSWSAPVLREFNKQLQEITSLSSNLS